MNRLHHSRQAHRSGGFSLMELMIVLAILAMISAMAAPQLMSMIRESTVFEAADRVRATLGQARQFAIDTGIDYEFRYELNGPAMVLLPSENELNLDDSGSQSTTTEEYIRLLVELSEDMRLRADAGVEELSETLDAEQFGSLGGSELSRKSWSRPIMFRFDGMADDFVFRVSDEEGLTSKIDLRGITGTARTSQVYQEED
ncbi:MAG: prepilin-type N-terminal cleavage/methylation domain-containing protein [Fuerstiella sp.]|jgi:prepilin-type N-terminal cleavage/methylation domain-containing protein|nr:prepilin-type N-terminal cleavage/methylation domain-containing protein [Fuerstiella sp.]MCP4512251.1 prepilin-type N-terminal cleavage/methylation domain-containing protein [Fuerstiella sp.]